MRSLSTSELLLRLLELAGPGGVTCGQATRALRREHRFVRLTDRVERGFEALVAEGLVEHAAGTGHQRFRATPAGHTALKRAGRIPLIGTVVFTDIVASTELIGAHGETGAHELRRRHFELLREQIALHGGREVKNLGDGLMVVFGGAAAAVRCAAAMQRAVAAGEDRLDMRVGIGAGELLHEDGDYFGSTVVVAQRLCAAAEPGEILISDDARARAASDDDGLAFTACGSLDLKGLREPVAAWSPARAGEPARTGTPEDPRRAPGRADRALTGAR